MLMFYARNAQKLGFQRIESSLKHVENEDITQADRLADAIADCVLSGEFEPGRRLDEGMLAERYGVSRTPVREALRRRRRSSKRCLERWPRSRRPARGWPL
jgi:hypothetical protein